MSLPYIKEIFDPIYGFIKLTEDEINTIDTLAFQRLHNISQLGTTHMVFPMARNTRFSHSIGVLALIQKLLKNLKELPSENNIKKPYDKLIDEQKQLIRISGLLHDIGHLPYSHCTENVIKNYLITKFPGIKSDLKGSLKFHEWLSGQIVRKTNIYNPISQNLSVQDDRNVICDIIKGNSKYNLFNQILHSELDVDRMDYLLRDSYSTGLNFGLIDLNQILRNLYVYECSPAMDPALRDVIVCSPKSINAIDNFYFARMFMFNSVYYHKTNSYYDYLLSKSYEISITSENLAVISNILPLKPDEILKPLIENDFLCDKQCNNFFLDWFSFDDYYLWNCLRECWLKLNRFSESTLNQDSKRLRQLLDRLFKRKNARLVWEKNLLKKIEPDRKLESVIKKKFEKLEEWIKNDLNKEYNHSLIVQNTEIDAPLKNIQEEDPENINDYEGDLTLFYDFDEAKLHYLHNINSSINYQSKKSNYYIFRVYDIEEENKSEELKEKISKKFQDF
jgi:hypothetical protein